MSSKLYYLALFVNIYGMISHGWLLYKQTATPRILAGYLAFNLLMTIFLLAKKSWVLIKLDSFVKWNVENEFRRERKIISSCLIGIFIVFSLKLRLGFYFSGVSGWVNQDFKSVHKIKKIEPPNDKRLDFFKSALIKENFKYLPHRFNQITYSVQLLNYDEKVTPINFNGTPFAFDNIIFRTNHSRDLIKHSVPKPLRFSIYPKFTSFMPIPFDTFKINSFSSWRVTFQIDRKTKESRIINADEEYTYEY